VIHSRAVPCYVIQVTGGFEDGADVGPMISVQAKERAEELIQVLYYTRYNQYYEVLVLYW
jgi:hypothetical protein